MNAIFNTANFEECISSLNDKIIYIKDGDEDQSPCEISDISNFDFKINNDDKNEIFFLKVDFCVFYEKDGKKCDFSVNDDKTIYFVEIKSLTDFSNSSKSLFKQKKKKDGALEQLIETIKKIKLKYSNLNLIEVFAVICLKPNLPTYTQIIQTASQNQINKLLIQTGCPNLLIGNEITFK